MADFRADPRRYKVSLKYLSVPKSKRVLLKKKKSWSMPQEHRASLKRLPLDKSREM